MCRTPGLCRQFVITTFLRSFLQTFLRVVGRNHKTNHDQFEAMFTTLDMGTAIHELYRYMCRLKWYGFQAVYSGIGRINQRVWV